MRLFLWRMLAQTHFVLVCFVMVICTLLMILDGLIIVYAIRHQGIAVLIPAGLGFAVGLVIDSILVRLTKTFWRRLSTILDEELRSIREGQ